VAKKKKTKKEKFKTKLVDKFDDEDFFDDCPVCGAMKFAQKHGRMPTPEELKEAFKKAKKKGAVVGGEWLEKSDNLKDDKQN